MFNGTEHPFDCLNWVYIAVFVVNITFSSQNLKNSGKRCDIVARIPPSLHPVSISNQPLSQCQSYRLIYIAFSSLFLHIAHHFYLFVISISFYHSSLLKCLFTSYISKHSDQWNSLLFLCIIAFNVCFIITKVIPKDAFFIAHFLSPIISKIFLSNPGILHSFTHHSITQEEKGTTV